MIDLRSDTVTRPTPAMRQAMANAQVGDDVFGDDPTVIRLQERLAEMLGKEGAYAQLSGLAARTVEGEFGVLRLEQLTGVIRGDNDHLVRTRLVCLENTHNRGSGRIQPYDEVVRICRWAHDHGLATHLDGARLFNAVVATGIPAAKWSQHFDTVNICFSKGLGAPVGSAIAGSKELMAKARRVRKLFGGGMRQAGIIAAGALYALEHHIDRLAEDHANAKILADAVRQ